MIVFVWSQPRYISMNRPMNPLHDRIHLFPIAAMWATTREGGPQVLMWTDVNEVVELRRQGWSIRAITRLTWITPSFGLIFALYLPRQSEKNFSVKIEQAFTYQALPTNERNKHRFAGCRRTVYNQALDLLSAPCTRVRARAGEKAGAVHARACTQLRLPEGYLFAKPRDSPTARSVHSR
jgi:hypothetical protein